MKNMKNKINSNLQKSTLVKNEKLTRIVNKVTKQYYLSSKERNKLIKQTNGNGKKSISIAHWNLGSKLWKNKRNQTQLPVDSTNPDLLYISEANLDEMTTTFESNIIGYNIIKPKSLSINKTSRLVLLVKDSVEVNIEEQLMDEEVTSIWAKVSTKGARKVLVCGVYREHQYMNQDTDWSLAPAEQLRRWKTFLRQVERAANTSSCQIIGDINLDYEKWANPDGGHAEMVNKTKASLETAGFIQKIEGTTRSWPDTTDSLIDQLWTNTPQRVLSWKNQVRSVGDHNVISAVIKIQRVDSRQLDTKRRSLKNVCHVSYREQLKKENWNEVYEIDDVDLIKTS